MTKMSDINNPWKRVWVVNPNQVTLLTWQELDGVLKLYWTGEWQIFGPVPTNGSSLRPVMKPPSNWEIAT